MKSNPAVDIQEAEAMLIRNRADFAGTYMAVANLDHAVRTAPEHVGESAVEALAELFFRRVHIGQRQAYFLYRKAARTIATVIVSTTDPAVASIARAALKTIVNIQEGPAHKAAAEALGMLPFSFPANRSFQRCSRPTVVRIPQVRWETLLQKAGLKENSSYWRMGRSLVFQTGTDQLVVIKTETDMSRAADLEREARWMEHLPEISRHFPVRFDIPEPIRVNGKYVCSVAGCPTLISDPGRKANRCLAICFTTVCDYFVYANDYRLDYRSRDEGFIETLTRNAWLLGRLASLGIVHTAPIPLFHNRVQRHRRNDAGLYEWFREGRLDQWLRSCQFPNMGKSGTRDFEHMEVFSGSSAELYRVVGSQIFSLALVAASYFRNKDITAQGRTENGKSVDARDLFDRDLLIQAVCAVFTSYYHGFTQREYENEFPFDAGRLADRMIEEMGVDRHMEEVLRLTDQQRMTAEAFVMFLSERGYSEDQIAGFQQGKADISILTGPHLGGFNQRISLPELIHYTAGTTATCIADRYWYTEALSAQH